MLKLRQVKTQTLSRRQFLELKPIRAEGVEWNRKDDGVIVLTVTVRGGILRTPKKKRLELDEVGSFVWELCDGQNSISKIAENLMQRYKLDRREAEVSLTAFFQQLSKRGLIAFGRTDPKIHHRDTEDTEND